MTITTNFNMQTNGSWRSQLVENRVTLNVDTTAGAIAITLPKISSLGDAFPSLEICIVDSGNATADNITITCGDVTERINAGASYVINADNESVIISAVGISDWIALA
jgi:hypothetical protein